MTIMQSEPPLPIDRTSAPSDVRLVIQMPKAGIVLTEAPARQSSLPHPDGQWVVEVGCMYRTASVFVS
jgi:hypothetical protein